jgi:hypothetical protein
MIGWKLFVLQYQPENQIFQRQKFAFFFRRASFKQRKVFSTLFG